MITNRAPWLYGQYWDVPDDPKLWTQVTFDYCKMMGYI